MKERTHSSFSRWSQQAVLYGIAVSDGGEVEALHKEFGGVKVIVQTLRLFSSEV